MKNIAKNLEGNVASIRASSFSKTNYDVAVSDEQIKKIKCIGHFRSGPYSTLDIRGALEFYTKRFVQQIFDFSPINNKTIVADIGAGYGWLGMAFAFCTHANVIIIEPDESRLRAGKEIAHILGINEQVYWCVGLLGGLPIKRRKLNLVYCIEVLEHVKKDTAAIVDLCSICNELLVITTPNLWFPVIAHDTRLPFCHWLPLRFRGIYAKIFRREYQEHGNYFWSPFSLKRNLSGFRRISKWLHYASYRHFVDTFPFYLPYIEFKYVTRLSLLKLVYYRVVSLMRGFSYYLLPSLSAVFIFKRLDNN